MSAACWKQACIAEGALARQMEAARRGMTGRDPAETARHIDALLQHAADMAVGVL